MTVSVLADWKADSERQALLDAAALADAFHGMNDPQDSTSVLELSFIGAWNALFGIDGDDPFAVFEPWRADHQRRMRNAVSTLRHSGCWLCQWERGGRVLQAALDTSGPDFAEIAQRLRNAAMRQPFVLWAGREAHGLGLKGTAKDVLECLAHHADENGESVLPVRRMENWCGKSRSTVVRALRKLDAGGLIETERREGPSLYRLRN